MHEAFERTFMIKHKASYDVFPFDVNTGRETLFIQIAARQKIERVAKTGKEPLFQNYRMIMSNVKIYLFRRFYQCFANV